MMILPRSGGTPLVSYHECVPTGIRTRVSALKGPRPNPWTMGTCWVGVWSATAQRGRQRTRYGTHAAAPAATLPPDARGAPEWQDPASASASRRSPSTSWRPSVTSSALPALDPRHRRPLQGPVATLVGNTPLLADGLRHSGRRTAVTVYAKSEQLNLTGSIKDRMALHILRQAYAGGSSSPATQSPRPPAATPESRSAAIGRRSGIR